MREACIEDVGIKIGRTRNLANLRYADDTLLIADNPTSMIILHRLDEARLKHNAQKTKVFILHKMKKKYISTKYHKKTWKASNICAQSNQKMFLH